MNLDQKYPNVVDMIKDGLLIHEIEQRSTLSSATIYRVAKAANIKIARVPNTFNLSPLVLESTPAEITKLRQRGHVVFKAGDKWSFNGFLVSWREIRCEVERRGSIAKAWMMERLND